VERYCPGCGRRLSATGIGTAEQHAGLFIDEARYRRAYRRVGKMLALMVVGVTVLLCCGMAAWGLVAVQAWSQAAQVSRTITATHPPTPVVPPTAVGP